MADTRHEAVWDWLLTCPHIGDFFFNASRAEDGNTMLIPSESVLVTYIDGSTLNKYNCALTRFLAYSPDPNDETNLIALIDFEKISSWIEDQIEVGNVPDFPSGYVLTDISVLPSESGFMVAQDMTQAKYMIQFQIEYIREHPVPTTSADGSGDTNNNQEE